jgi:hypothetical protein
VQATHRPAGELRDDRDDWRRRVRVLTRPDRVFSEVKYSVNIVVHRFWYFNTCQKAAPSIAPFIDGPAWGYPRTRNSKGELGAAFWHLVPKMSGFLLSTLTVHVDSPTNGPRLATTT